MAQLLIQRHNVTCLKMVEEGLLSWEKILTRFMEELECETSKQEIIEKNTNELAKEVEILKRNSELEKENSLQQQREIQSHLSTIKHLQIQRDSYLERIGKELSAQTRLIKANYEVSFIELPWNVSLTFSILLSPD